MLFATPGLTSSHHQVILAGASQHIHEFSESACVDTCVCAPGNGAPNLFINTTSDQKRNCTSAGPLAPLFGQPKALLWFSIPPGTQHWSALLVSVRRCSRCLQRLDLLLLSDVVVRRRVCPTMMLRYCSSQP